ncbi:F-actin capping protein, alpha subunit [Saitoella complicata NRRL Y-17804]|nr:F-actin capping protein, alpha subunit [Saitoella complicata NRRL Y-17804]ODQ53793.1 F-actin capping protein, alpha subunit [Saitoella complicata NRRL Y-17804]
MPFQQQKIAAASQFLLASPPGELNDVFNDIASLVNDDTAVLNALEPAFEKYNLEQYVTVKLPLPGGEGEGLSLVSEWNRVAGEEGRFVDPRVGKTFVFDHVKGKASDVQPYDEDLGREWEELNTGIEAYVNEHFPSEGASGVFKGQAGGSTWNVVIVGNKYNPSNYWNGRWRSSYTFDSTSGTLTGTIRVTVHYYEDGNVSLSTTHSISSTPSSPSTLAKTIAAEEKRYQEELNKAFGGLSEGPFKGLRRQLPVTRQRVDWEKAGVYRIGQDVGNARR